MLLTKRNKLIAIAAITMALSLVTFAMDYQYGAFFAILRGLQLVATVALLFGILKKEPLHKDKFLLFWLAITSLLFGFLCFYCMEYLTRDLFRYYDFGDLLLNLLLLLALLSATALQGFMMYFVYQEFVELTQNNSESSPAPMETDGVVKTKELPPPYGTTGALSVSIQN